jgi:hypothetical protein
VDGGKFAGFVSGFEEKRKRWATRKDGKEEEMLMKNNC